jgi:hypothetical protein
MKQLGRFVRIRTVKVLKGFMVSISFEDGTQRDIDLKPYLHGPVFELIRNDPDKFRKMKVESGVITWDNGADIDPDVLYYDLKPAWIEIEQEIVR